MKYYGLFNENEIEENEELIDRLEDILQDIRDGNVQIFINSGKLPEDTVEAIALCVDDYIEANHYREVDVTDIDREVALFVKFMIKYLNEKEMYHKIDSDERELLKSLTEFDLSGLEIYDNHNVSLQIVIDRLIDKYRR